MRKGVAIAAFLALTACTLHHSPHPLPDGYFLFIDHSSGGPAPFASVVAFYPDGRAVYRFTNVSFAAKSDPRHAFAH